MRSLQGFEEAFFYLSLSCKRLLEGLRLGLDAQFFEERLLDDADFMDSILFRIQKALDEHPNLIQRDEYKHQLVTTRALYLEVLAEMLRQADRGVMFTAKVPDLRDIHQRHQHEITETLTYLEAAGKDLSAEEVISRQEMAFLLNDDHDPSNPS